MMRPIFNTFKTTDAHAPARTTKHYIMHSDVRENKENYLLDIDLPGFQKEDIKAQVKDGYLCVEARRCQESDEKEDDARKVIHKERFDGVYRRTFYIGTDITQDDITASYKHGVLHLHIPKNPKKDQRKTGTIQIA